MDNRILDVRLDDHSLDPVSAEVWVTVTPKHLTPTTEVRGRLLGPSCPYASTVEVAYPLLPPRPNDLPNLGTLQRRVVIPEPGLWDTQSPFLYAGPVELWQDGQRCDRVQVTHGLRQFSLTPGGLRVNGRPLTVEGTTCEACFPEQVRALRARGGNTLLIPVRSDTLAVWDVADRYGLLVLGRLGEEEQEMARLLHELRWHPSCFGWTVGPSWLEGRHLSRLAQGAGIHGRPLVGIEGGHGLAQPLPEAIAFVVCREEDPPIVAAAGRPILLLVQPSGPNPRTAALPPLLGRIETVLSSPLSSN